MSLRAASAAKQSPAMQGDCFGLGLDTGFDMLRYSTLLDPQPSQ